MRELATLHGIQVASAGIEDFKPHNTLLIADFPQNVDPITMQEKLNHLNSGSSHLQQVAQILKGREIILNQLVLSGSFMYICTGDFSTGDEEMNRRIQDSVYGLRRVRYVIEKIYIRDAVYGTLGQNITRDIVSLAVPQGDGTYNNILHSSVGRISSNATSERLTQLAQAAYQQFGEPLQQHPIVATVESTFIGTAYEHAMQRKPDIFSQ